MYITPPKVSASLHSGITTASGPATTSGVGTLGQYLAVITPAGGPGIFATALSTAVAMILFRFGWIETGKKIARSKMPSVSPADKSALFQTRVQGIVAESIFGGALYLVTNDVKPWVFVGGLPIAAWFLPGLIRHSWIPFMGPSKEQVGHEQNKRRQKQAKQAQRQLKSGEAPVSPWARQSAYQGAQPSIRRPFQERQRPQLREREVFYEGEESIPASPSPERLARQRGRRRIPR